jgi:preprotein translocase subunit SecA
MLKGLLKLFLGDKSSSDLKELQPVVDEILKEEELLLTLTADELRGKTAELKVRINAHISDLQSEINSLKAEAAAMSESDLEAKEAVYNKIDQLDLNVNEELEVVLAEILPEAFALVKETAKRFATDGDIEVTALDYDKDIAAEREMVKIVGEKAYWSSTWKAAGSDVKWEMVHYDVQLVGGVALHRGSVAEMHTGEGKTLVATLPVFLNALTGKGVHLVTVNDYLARRDSEWMGPIYEFHGLTVDCIDRHQPNSEARREAYKCDITFGTNNEFGFDYLRDNMAQKPDMLVQRPHHYAIVDEVDSVLIDEARTPLIISGPTPKGDEQEFESLKPMVVKLIQIQQKTVQGFLTEAKKLLTDDISKDEKESAGLAMYRAFRGLPKSKPLIKLLGNEGMRQLLLKVEGYYLSDNQKEMPKADAELYFVIDEKQNQIELSEKGIAFLTTGMEDDGFFTLPDLATSLVTVDNSESSDEDKLARKQDIMQDFGVKSARIHSMNQLIKAYTLFEKDNEYVIMDNKVKIVDEQTGRIMDGRRYSDGLHQAIEAKENVKIEAATQTYATVTLQNFFRMYHKLAGMTGTAETEAGEFWDIYKLDVKVIPTNRPIVRDDRDDLVYKTKREKYHAVIDEVEILSKAGRPILVGTTTVEVSELLSRMLDMRGLDHQVLNAKRHQQEADIVTRAGQAGTITIATNMAGRGTDIKLSKEVKESGGLAIVGTERHDSRRVDRQLRGRAGRQGDPGSSQFYASLEDDLMRLFGSDRVAKMMDRMGHQEGEVIQHKMISKSIERAQTKVEENNFGVRKRLLEYDDVMNAQREVIYKRRRNALHGDRISTDIANMFFELVEVSVDSTHENKDYDGFKLSMLSNLGMDVSISTEDFQRVGADVLVYQTYSKADSHYRLKIEDLTSRAHPVIKKVYDDDSNDFKNILVPFSDGIKTIQVTADIDESVATEAKSVMRALEKQVMLAVIDSHWKEHLRSMDDLRANVQHARHEQKDPLLIYKFESFELFKQMIGVVNAEVASFLMKCTIPTNTGEQPVQRAHRVENTPQGKTSKAGVQNIAQQNAASRASGGGVISPGAQGRPQAPQRPQAVAPIRSEKKVQPNSPCPCGSGKKYKKCHGK